MTTVPKTQPNMRSYDPELVAMRWIGDAADRTLTFRHFAERSDRLANALEELGLAAGDRVLIRKKA
jgi:acyl-coenzyme A synthetase/AMP-(fatty) acid ligase